MTTDKPDGGPAFPIHATAPGVTKREWFAAHALQGLLMQGYDKFCIDEWTAQAYAYADAMLKAGVEPRQDGVPGDSGQVVSNA